MVSTVNTADTLGTALGVAEIAGTANITGTQGVALVFKEAAEDALRACQIVGAA